MFEFGDGETVDFRHNALKNKGRLIYYTEDVRTGGHILNQSMLPIYGPIKYNGNPIFLQFTVLELDVKEAGQIKSLLSVLAGLGAKAYAPASPVLKSLDAIGSQLLSGDQDDIEFQYSFVLHPEGGQGQFAKYSHLTTGDYLLVRMEPNDTYTQGGQYERFDPIDWKEDFVYCPKHGRLIKKEPDTCDCDTLVDAATEQGCEYRQNTYLVIQINTGFNSVGLDVTQAFLEFQQEIEQQEVDYSELQAELTAEFDEYIAAAKLTSARAKIEQLHSMAIHALQTACSAEGDREARRHFAELYDLLINKRGFPEEPAEWSDSQWTRMLFAMREVAADPYLVSKESVEGATGPEELAEQVIKCGD